MGSTLMGCPTRNGRLCCNHAGGPVLLGGAAQTLALEGLYCTGDDSATCCNAPAYGQVVVATGLLERAPPSPDRTTSGWRLSGVSLCAPPAPTSQ